MLQNIRATNLLSVLQKEWEYWKDKGKIKEDYHTTEQHLNCLHELLEFLDKDIPDELRFNTLKKILLIAASEKISSRDDILPQQFMRICKSLSSGGIIVLSTAYDLAKKNNFNFKEHLDAENWLKIIAENSPLKSSSLVELHENNLMELKLISSRTHSDRSGILFVSRFRLTDLGIDFCKYIETYDSIKP
jgi:hypothetical protein